MTIHAKDRNSVEIFWSDRSCRIEAKFRRHCSKHIQLFLKQFLQKENALCHSKSRLFSELIRCFQRNFGSRPFAWILNRPRYRGAVVRKIAIHSNKSAIVVVFFCNHLRIRVVPNRNDNYKKRYYLVDLLGWKH